MAAASSETTQKQKEVQLIETTVREHLSELDLKNKVSQFVFLRLLN